MKTIITGVLDLLLAVTFVNLYVTSIVFANPGPPRERCGNNGLNNTKCQSEDVYDTTKTPPVFLYSCCNMVNLGYRVCDGSSVGNCPRRTVPITCTGTKYSMKNCVNQTTKGCSIAAQDCIP